MQQLKIHIAILYPLNPSLIDLYKYIK